MRKKGERIGVGLARGGGAEAERGTGVFAELVPSFLTQLPRHGDLWWLGNGEITGAASPCPGFLANRNTFPPCSARVSIDSAYFKLEKSSSGSKLYFPREEACQILSVSIRISM